MEIIMTVQMLYLDLTIETGENSKLSFYHWHKIEDVYRDVVFDGGNIKNFNR